MTDEITENNNAPKILTGRERSLANLKEPFSSENQPAKSGRTPGSLNRATLFQKWLEAKALKKFKDEILEELGDDAPDLECIADLFMAKKVLKALNGNEATIDSMLENLFGKLAENINQNTNASFTLGNILSGLSKTKPPPLPKVSPAAPDQQEIPCSPQTQSTPMPSLTPAPAAPTLTPMKPNWPPLTS